MVFNYFFIYLKVKFKTIEEREKEKEKEKNNYVNDINTSLNNYAKNKRFSTINNEKKDYSNSNNYFNSEFSENDNSIYEPNLGPNDNYKTITNEEFAKNKKTSNILNDNNTSFNTYNNNKINNSNNKINNKINLRSNSFCSNNKLNFKEKVLKTQETINDNKDGIFSQIFNQNSYENLDSNLKKEILMKPIDKGFWIRCNIDRIKKGRKGYVLSLSDNGNKIMCAFKRSKNICANYMIRLDYDFESEKKDINYIGKLKSNFFCTEYNLFDSGENPKRAKNKENIRKELGAISYVINFFLIFS